MPQLIDPPADWQALEPHPVAALFPSPSGEEYETLRQDILERGQQEAVLMYEGKILDGKARHRAAKELGLVPAFAEWEGDQTTLAAWLAAKGSNLVRRHLTPERRVAVLLRSAEVLPDVQHTIQAVVGAAELRKQLGMKVAKQANSKGEAADIIGRIVGVSGSTVKRVRRVQERFPERLIDLAEGRTTCGRLLKVIPEAEPPAPAAGGPPAKKYKLIYADIGDKKLEEKPVPAWAMPKSALALWSSAARLSDAFRLVLQWGWTYQSMLVWDKGKEAEMLVLAARHYPPLGFKGDKMVIKDKPPPQGGKSELFREIIVHTFPDTDGSRLDLLGPPPPEGWDQEPAPVNGQ